jgi:hypothetical protein
MKIMEAPFSSTTGSSSKAVATPSVWQSLGSVLLFAHLFFLAVSLSANQAPSAMQNRLLSVFRPYIRLLNFDVAFVRFHLTHASGIDAEHRIEYLPAGANAQDADAWVPLMDGARGSDRLARYQRLGDLLAMLGSSEEGTASAEVVSAVGTHLVKQAEQPVDQIRSRRHLLQSPEDLTGANLDRRDPNDPSFFQEVYRAQVVDLGGERLGVQKVESLGQVAPSVSGRKRTQKTNEPAESR